MVKGGVAVTVGEADGAPVAIVVAVAVGEADGASVALLAIPTTLPFLWSFTSGLFVYPQTVLF